MQASIHRCCDLLAKGPELDTQRRTTVLAVTLGPQLDPPVASDRRCEGWHYLQDTCGTDERTKGWREKQPARGHSERTSGRSEPGGQDVSCSSCVLGIPNCSVCSQGTGGSLQLTRTSNQGSWGKGLKRTPGKYLYATHCLPK